jgi:hypothetical protein
MNEIEECSMNLKNIVNLTKEKYDNRLNWLKIKNNNQNESKEFKDIFLNDFINLKTQKINENDEYKFCRINNTKKDTIPNDPFNFVIKDLPNLKIDEHLTLMYEEVRINLKRIDLKLK